MSKTRARWTFRRKIAYKSQQTITVLFEYSIFLDPTYTRTSLDGQWNKLHCLERYIFPPIISIARIHARHSTIIYINRKHNAECDKYEIYANKTDRVNRVNRLKLTTNKFLIFFQESCASSITRYSNVGSALTKRRSGNRVNVNDIFTGCSISAACNAKNKY